MTKLQQDGGAVRYFRVWPGLPRQNEAIQCESMRSKEQADEIKLENASGELLVSKVKIKCCSLVLRVCIQPSQAGGPGAQARALLGGCREPQSRAGMRGTP
jgi:hypothetical protein